jgi:hypothetical protein
MPCCCCRCRYCCLVSERLIALFASSQAHRPLPEPFTNTRAQQPVGGHHGDGGGAGSQDSMPLTGAAAGREVTSLSAPLQGIRC